MLHAPQLRQALDAAAGELSSLSADKASFDQQHTQAQESIDALVAELQDTLARLDQEQQQAGQLSERLQKASKEGAEREKQVSQITTAQYSAMQYSTVQAIGKNHHSNEQQAKGL